MYVKKPEGTPKVFVAGGAGTGVFIYRELQRLGIAFRAGILYENDCDFPVAKALASEVITEKMFEPIGKDTFEAACRKIDESCNRYGVSGRADECHVKGCTGVCSRKEKNYS